VLEGLPDHEFASNEAGAIGRPLFRFFWGQPMPCCLENKLVSGADLADADQARIGAALGAMLRRPLRRSANAEIDGTAITGHFTALASIAPARPGLAL